LTFARESAAQAFVALREARHEPVGQPMVDDLVALAAMELARSSARLTSRSDAIDLPVPAGISSVTSRERIVGLVRTHRVPPS
jgi:hypothetical protein